MTIEQQTPTPRIDRLIVVELRRASMRRSLRIMAALSIAGVLLGSLIVALKSQPASTPNDALIEQRVSECVAGRNEPPIRIFTGHGEEGFTERPPGPGGEFTVPVDSPQREQYCRLGWEQALRGQDRTFRLTSLKGILTGTSVPLVLVGLIFGATLIAAEWRTGNLATQLSWEPRRIRVMLAKLLAAIVAAVVFYVVIQTILALTLTLAAMARGSTGGADVGGIASNGARFVVLVVLATGFGFGVGSIGKNSAAALGVLAGYLIIAEQLLAIVPWLRPWLLSLNGVAFIVGGIDEAEFVSRSALEGFLTLLLYSGGAVVTALGLFRTRDVLS